MRHSLLFFPALLLTAASLGAQELAPFNQSIRQADLKADVALLAADSTRGRFLGTPEYAWTADFLASRFQRLGLLPAGDDGTYFHHFTLMAVTQGTNNSLRITRGQGASQEARPRLDFYPHRFGATARAEAPVTFAGFGITAPKLGYDDYRADIAGRIVLILEHEPGERDPDSPFDGVVTAEPAVPFRKVLAAQAKGAVGVLMVSDVHNHDGVPFEETTRAYWPTPTPRIDRHFLKDYLEQIHIPVAQVSPEVAATLLEGTGHSLEALSRASETATGFTPLPLPGVTVSMSTDVVRHPIPDRSVLAVLEGSDPALKHEYVLISAHHDHNGADDSGIYSGADDNASGTAAVLDIAEAYALAAEAGQRPRRSIIFAVFGSEERGPLLGSWAYVERPTRPLDRTIAVINMDMIGRNMEVPANGGARFAGLPVQTAESNRNAVNLLGGSRAPALRDAAVRANEAFGLRLKQDLDNSRSNMLRRSDQWPFLQRGVPAIWFHTGLHPDYHTPRDRPERLEYEKMERIARLVHHLSWALAK